MFGNPVFLLAFAGIALIVIGAFSALNRHLNRRARHKLDASAARPSSNRMVEVATETTKIVRGASVRGNVLTLGFDDGKAEQFTVAGDNERLLRTFHSTWRNDPEVLNGQTIRFHKTPSEQYATILSIN